MEKSIKCKYCKHDNGKCLGLTRKGSHKYCFEPKIATTADKIRSMTDEELVNFLWRFTDSDIEDVLPFCKHTVACGEQLDSSDITDDMCKRCLLDRLRQPCDGSLTVEKGSDV